MEVLARELDARGIPCAMVPCDETNVVEAPVVVVDSFRFRADDPARVRAGFVIAVDDVCRDLAVDVVVDPTPGAQQTAHRRARRVCAGGEYALVGAAAPGAVPAGAAVDRVLVTTGAADAEGAGACAAADIARAVPGVEVRLVVGPWGHSRVPAGVTAVRVATGLAGEIASVPVVVTAGGVTMIEACHAGRATVAMVVADNQRRAVAGLRAVGAVVEVTPESAATAVARLVAAPEEREALGTAAHRQIDGKGPARVADIVEAGLR